jgi:hypothetical protein
VSSSGKRKKLLSPDPSQMVIRMVLRVPLLTRIFHPGYSSLETSPLSQTKPKRRERNLLKIEAGSLVCLPGMRKRNKREEIAISSSMEGRSGSSIFLLPLHILRKARRFSTLV